MKRVLVNGAGGFIGGHLVKRLKAEGFWVRAVDLKRHAFFDPPADEFIQGDLRDPSLVRDVVREIDVVYQLAADMGGAGYIFTGEHDADVMHNSATINLNCLHFGVKAGVRKFFYSSSACMYPEYNQVDSLNPKCVPRIPPILRRPTASMAGRNCSVSGFTSPTCGTMASKCGSPGSPTSSVPKARGRAVERRRRLRCAVRLRKPKTAARSRSGATASRLARSSISMNASRVSAAWLTRNSPGRGILVRRKWSRSTNWPG